MNKILPLIVFGILVLSGLAVADIKNENILNEKNDYDKLYFSDELDQYQTIYVEDSIMPVGRITIPNIIDVNFQVAQSFKPSREVLTRVELYVSRNATATEPFVVAIRDELTGENLAITSADPEEFVIQDFSWVEFDFYDVPVNINKTYYIVTHTVNISNNFYYWGANDNYESYPNGCAWMSIDNGDTWVNESEYVSSNHDEIVSDINCMKSLNNEKKWTIENIMTPLNNNDTTWDMCFMTYGRNEPPMVHIEKPKYAIYFSNEEICDFFQPVIIGIIKIQVDASDYSGIDRVEFYINNEYVGKSTSTPYNWIWSDILFFKHFLKVVAVDNLGLTAEHEMEVWKFF